MKKKQLLFLIVSCVLLQNSIFAQKNESKQARFDSAPEPERRKWELGVDLLNLINGTFDASDVSGAPYKQGYLILRRYSLDKINKSALEMRLGAYVSDVRVTGSNSNGLDILSQKYNLTFGYEFQKQQGRFMLIYGPQIKTLLGSKTVNSVIVNPLPINGEYTTSQSNGYSIAGGGFIGARFFFNSRLSISVSTNFEIGNSYTRTVTKIFDSTSNLLKQEADGSRNETGVRGGLLMSNIGFHF